MDAFIIQGGKRLSGEVSVSGAKNAALPMMAAALLAEGCSTFHSVPNLVDVATLSTLLETLGCQVRRDDSGMCGIEVISESDSHADYDLVRRMRASVCVLGPLLAKRGFARVSLPGGCNIGHRPIDLHLKGLQALGAEIRVESGYVEACAKRLQGAVIDLAGPHGSTVTGTCNVMSAATLARGTTVITSAAQEPEVVALAEYLNAMGAQVSGQGTSTIRIEGVESLSGAECTIIPDRIEGATLMIAAGMTYGDVILDNLNIEHLSAVVDLLRQIGIVIESVSKNSVHVRGDVRMRSAHVIAAPYPEIPTDVQAQLMACLAAVPGTSLVEDRVFPDRFMHCAELNRMGAKIQLHQNRAIIRGVDKLQGANVMASDLRASAALVLAGLAAQGETIVRRIYHLDRGYESLEVKLRALGANVVRCREEQLAQKAA